MSITPFQITKTVRIATHGHPELARIGILALHGYGQLAPYFIRKFQQLDPNKFFVAAPEGPHRFYTAGTSGRVGASWMTKEDRLSDIADNMAYLNQVYATYFSGFAFEKLVVLGFSQGAATAARWIEQRSQKVDAFIQWAGVFPPDLNLQVNSGKFNALQHFYVVGNQDPYYRDSEYLEQQKQWLNQQQLNPEFVSFHGVHTIDFNCLSDILHRI